ncbi:MAG TPA: pyrroloquinoline quinone-dependent dehydrogenase [Bryobacteraceae bacterium]|jgi:glucose dehydrogenase|nr:pyrroloquinoline quinone-dependent dehydrogenase [Bryobacteraceae bacterium]
MRSAFLFFSSLLALPMLHGQTDWPAYGGDLSNTRYSALDQINTQNITKLSQAWVYDLRPQSGTKASRPAQATPLVVNGVMYVVTAYQSLVALDPQTGKQIWAFIHKHSGRPPRGIAYWPGDKTNPAEIVFGTGDGFLIAVDAKTGQAVPGFGKEGEIDLKPGVMGKFTGVHYGLSGAPVIYKDLAITGSHTQDSPGLGSRGDARAWDVRTGKLVWTFHSVPQPGEKGHETWLNDGWQDRSGVNAWTTSSIDPQTGTLYMTFDSPSYDLYGGDRPGNDLFGNSLVALDAATGKLKWYFQTIHHDVWDYDAPATPTLVDVNRNGQRIPAVIQTGKTGLVFILDRRSGKPIYPVEERPVPKGDVPGEWYSPTQPFPVKPPPLTRLSITRDEIAKVTPEQQKFCEALFDAEGGAHNDGPFTPVGMKPTVVFPGGDGGGNWGSGSVDPKLGYFFLNTKADGAIARMIKPGDENPPAIKDGLGEDVSANAYIRTGIRVAGAKREVGSFSNPSTGWPCEQPPWGELTAVNYNTGDVAWRIPFGRVDALEAKGVMNTGSFNKGGSVATAGGLLFIGASYDQRFHAYESKTGKLLWEVKLASDALANPLTYQGKNGKQYVVVDAGDSILAYALP